MSVAPSNPPNQPDQPARPDLHVVPDAEPGAATSTAGESPLETDNEITGPIPILDADGNPVAARAPWDVQLREQLLSGARAIPAFGRVPASFAESLEYSQKGDWATSDSGLKRVVHGLATIIAFLATYPFVEGLGKAREKPIGLVVVLAVLIALLEFLAS